MIFEITDFSAKAHYFTKRNRFCITKKTLKVHEKVTFFRPKTCLKNPKTVTSENFFQCVYLEDMVI